MKLTIINKNSLKITLPNHKTNLYYEPSEKLNRFDEVEIAYYSDKNKKTILSFDIIREILMSLSGSLEDAINTKLELPSFIKKSEFGKFYNETSYQITIEDNEDLTTEEKNNLDLFSKHWLFSDESIQTWIYNVEDKICIEITPSYKWLYQDPKLNEKFIPFKEFREHYKPYDIFCIDKKIASQWKLKCDEILKDL